MAVVAGRVHGLSPRAPMPPALAPLVLASASPRRTEILARAEWEHDVAPEDVDETPRPEESPRAACERLARDKAMAGARGREVGTVLGADTVVILGSRLLGKPVDREDARAMLLDLSGASHEVATAAALVRAADGACVSGVAVSRVRFEPLDEDCLRAYLDAGEWQGKAGSYAIQGLAGSFAQLESGDIDTVVGLSMALVRSLARRLEETR